MSLIDPNKYSKGDILICKKSFKIRVSIHSTNDTILQHAFSTEKDFKKDTIFEIFDIIFIDDSTPVWNTQYVKPTKYGSYSVILSVIEPNTSKVYVFEFIENFGSQMDEFFGGRKELRKEKLKRLKI